MRSAGKILIQIPQKLKNEVKLSDGKVLYLDPTYNKFENRVVDAKLYSVPEKWSHIFNVGDRVWFHHSLVLGNDQVVADWQNDIFQIDYTEEHTFNCLIYMIERDGKRWTVNDFVFVKPIEEEQYTKIGSIFVPETANQTETWRAEVVYLNDYVRDSLGIEKGNQIVFTRDQQTGKVRGSYEMEIDGEILWRMRSDRNILAIVEDGLR